MNLPIPPGNPYPVSPDEVKLLNYLRVRSLFADQAIAAMELPDTETRMVGQVPYQEVPIADPQPWLAVANDTAWMLSDRTIQFIGGGATANTEVQGNFSWMYDTAVYALVGTVRDTNFTPAANQSVWWERHGLADPLDAFLVQFTTTSNRNWQTAPVPASMVLGDARRPRFLGRPCWRMPGGSSLIVKVTPLFNNLTITLGTWVVETVSGSNIQSLS